LFPSSTTRYWKDEWEKFYSNELESNRTVGHNKVEVKEALPESLDINFLTDAHIQIAIEIVGENVGLYNHRFVIKDKFSKDSVFLHQDSCYHIGFPNKFSFFTPITKSSPENGGMGFYLGTHQYGLLGDAGEINPDAFDDQWPIVHPIVNPGDLIIMHSCLWHFSSPYETGEDRVLADTILQSSSDPSTSNIIHGKIGSAVHLSNKDVFGLFKRSRATRMIELTNQLNNLIKK
jgi:ectoine hydroxylase-related dioxygenase (phytanoyl-CoA dioxygenase family)